MMPPPFHIIIAVVNDLMLRGLAYTIAKEQSLKLLTTVANARELLQAIKEHQPDVSVIDTSLTDKAALDIMHELQEVSPLTIIIALSEWNEPGLILEARKAGATGLVSKNTCGDEIVDTIQETLRGKEHCCPISARRLEEDARAEKRGTRKIKLKKLTGKEIKVIYLSGLGYTNARIGEEMGLRKRSIDTMKIRIGYKINARSTAEMVKYAMDNKLIL